MFVLTPAVGPFAPLNLRFLEASGTARVIKPDEDLIDFGDSVLKLQRSGALAEMAARGWGRYDINGFANIAQFLVQRA